MNAVEWEYQRMLVPRGTTRRACTQLLTEKAERDHWELDRLQLYPDGTRRVVLRRRVIRVQRTSASRVAV
jgi:hypothetical protein